MERSEFSSNHIRAGRAEEDNKSKSELNGVNPSEEKRGRAEWSKNIGGK